MVFIGFRAKSTLARKIDDACGKNRSQFVRDAVKEALLQRKIPVQDEEFQENDRRGVGGPKKRSPKDVVPHVRVFTGDEGCGGTAQLSPVPAVSHAPASSATARSVSERRCGEILHRAQTGKRSKPDAR